MAQPQLALAIDVNTEQRFRDLYYHLYSNSSSSRSERILADLSKLILVSILQAGPSPSIGLKRFLTGKATANESLLPELVTSHPRMVRPTDFFSLDDKAIRHCLEILAEIDLVSSPSHTFGDAFQALMGPRLRGDKGQFFTPRSVVRALVDILAPAPTARVIDPACGTGGFLSAVLDLWKGQPACTGHVVGIDKDQDLSLLASALSAVHGNSAMVDVHNANSLALDQLESEGIKLGTFDYVMTNPPFGAKIGIPDRATLAQFELGSIWDRGPDSWQRTTTIRASQDPQVLFLELCVRLLRPGGRMAIVLPEGLFGNTGAGYVWDYIRAQGQILGLIDCPRTTFQPGTDTKTNILLFERSERPSGNEQSWVAVAYACGHDKRGRSTKSDGRPVADDFGPLARDWALPPSRRKLWSKADIDGSYYLVPRYYDQRLTDEVEQDAQRLGSDVITLGELARARHLTIRKGHEVGSEAYGTGDIPFVRTSDIHNFEVSHDPTNCISEDYFAQYAPQQKLEAGDILMVVDGRYKIGRCAILHEWSKRCVVQSHLKIISAARSSPLDTMALLYALSLPSVQREIRRLVFIQSTLGGLGSRISEVRVPNPLTCQNWGDLLPRFREAVTERARHSAYLRRFGNEVEL
jgi:type I restriction enzyme M protein